ncbi:MAG: hypothetical protein KIT62_09995 [Cyclobacteriaceae bacterium]|nr:hypothetical protein [Cyclobacteriaceae bacterium]
MKIKPALLALLIGGFGFITLASVVYAFVQHTEVNRQASIAIENEMIAIECEQKADELNQQLNKQTEQLRQALEAVTQKMHLLEEQASKSKNKK